MRAATRHESESHESVRPERGRGPGKRAGSPRPGRRGRAASHAAARWAAVGLLAAAVWAGGCSSPKGAEVMPTLKQIKARREAREAAARQAARANEAMNQGIASTPAPPARGHDEGARPTEVVWGGHTEPPASPTSTASPDSTGSGPPAAIARPPRAASANAPANSAQPAAGARADASGSATPNAPASLGASATAPAHGNAPGAAPAQPSDAAQPETEAEPGPAPAPLHVADLPRAALVADLQRRIRKSDHAPVDAAVRSVLLSIADATDEPDPAVFKPLTTPQRERVARFQAVVLRLKAALGQDGSGLDRDKLAGYFDKVFGTRPVSIDRVELCKRVRGYGVYNPFPDHTFLAGQTHRMIVYSELSHFQSVPVGGGQQEVSLQQQVMLFTDSDGLIVWQHDPVKIVDHSRNKRHDFFTIQMITLPARLTVGKYRLKVSVTDRHGGSVDETAVPLRIVADQALASGHAGADKPKASKANSKLEGRKLIRDLLGAGKAGGGQ